MKKRYVAVVTKNDFTSARQFGDWACFVDDDKEVAIRRAMEARHRWEANGSHGPYEIFIGLLTERIQQPAFVYTLERLK